MSDRIPQPLFDSAGNVQTDLARRRCGTLARALRAGLEHADRVTATRDDPDRVDAHRLALDALAGWLFEESRRWHL